MGVCPACSHACLCAHTHAHMHVCMCACQADGLHVGGRRVERRASMTVIMCAPLVGQFATATAKPSTATVLALQT